ncbi:MAG: hypothetical protein JSW48_04415 [Betaproteobacteria bacterium]|jgi:hypothetical protein|nr:MAG: hypothetical protein JSW48_04415 [Betaproteobacteria bacterium]
MTASRAGLADARFDGPSVSLAFKLPRLPALLVPATMLGGSLVGPSTGTEVSAVAN